jgi:hypothetical protein
VARSIIHIGKESNRLDELQAGLIQDQREACLQYTDGAADEFERLVRPVLKELGVREVARRTGLSPSRVSGVCRGAMPRSHSKDLYLQVAVEHARSSLAARGQSVPGDALAILTAYRVLAAQYSSSRGSMWDSSDSGGSTSPGTEEAR